jgi:hypothetical protein
MADLLNPKSGIYASYEEVFGGNIFVERPPFVESIERTFPLVSEYFELSVGPILESMVEFLKDWSVGKNLVYTVDSMVDKARKNEQAIADKKIADLQKELASMKRKNDVMKSEKAKTDKKSDKLTSEIESLRFVEMELKREKDICASLKTQVAEHADLLAKREDSIQELERKAASLLTELMAKTMALDEKIIEGLYVLHYPHTF